jgi:AAA domain/REase_MTES_1575/Protein of unknown function (DUF4011)
MNAPTSSPANSSANGFDALLAHAAASGGLDSEDLRNAIVPLLEEAIALHEDGFVAPLRGLKQLRVDDQYQVGFQTTEPSLPSKNRAEIARVEKPVSQAFDVTAELQVTRSVDDGVQQVASLDIVELRVEIIRPCFVGAYETWEHQVGHHDEITDVFSFGILLASLALGLDFRVRVEFEQFVMHRTNLFTLQPELHPVVARLIVDCTEPRRNLRLRDLESVAQRLRNYRDQPLDFDLAQLGGATSGPIPQRRLVIQQALRDRLFEINRRNRLLYFSPTQQSLNLTIGSVPLLLDVRNLRAEQIATWKAPLSDSILSGKPIALNTLLRFEDAPYLPGVLDKLISQARRDRNEYGMAQLRLVVCFLRWHNLKEVQHERINSPLLLLPVELIKKRGVRDSYLMTVPSTIAEVNPALRHFLRQTYGIELPEVVDLNEESVDELHARLTAQIQASEPGVTLVKVDKPQLELVLQRARLRVDQYRRRSQASVRTVQERSYSYSYAPGDLRPLGIQLFEQKVRYRPPETLRNAAGAPPLPRSPKLTPIVNSNTSTAAAPAPGEIETSRKTFSLKDSNTGNPYRWELDLCSLTLANFNYRKMTLVRDYNQLIGGEEPSDSFDRIFSLDARPVETEGTIALALHDQHLVVPADATQRAALAKSRSGRSFIIQGPPGTGKSQTITNLIADYVAQGKRVLFVCEKRAAIDVVHARLRSQGLDELCAVIHDSQADKRAFIQDLKSTYESWLEAGGAPGNTNNRKKLLDRITNNLAALQRIESAMESTPRDSDVALRALLLRAIELRALEWKGETAAQLLEHGGSGEVGEPGQPEELAGPSQSEESVGSPQSARSNQSSRPIQSARSNQSADAHISTNPHAQTPVNLPTVAEWNEQQAAVRRLEATLLRVGESGAFALHPLAETNTAIIEAQRPQDELLQRATRAIAAITGLQSKLESVEMHVQQADAAFTGSDLDELVTLCSVATRIAPSRLGVLKPRSPAAAELLAQLHEQSTLRKVAAETKEKAALWRKPLERGDAVSGLELARSKESSLFKVFSGDWRSLKATVAQRYDFEAHAVRPSVVSVLEVLIAAIDAERALADNASLARQQYGESDLAQVARDIEDIHQLGSPTIRALRDRLASENADVPSSTLLAAAVNDLDPQALEARESLVALFSRNSQRTLSELGQRAEQLKGSSGQIVELLGDLRTLAKTPSVDQAIRTVPLSADALELAVMQRAIRNYEDENADVERFDGRAHTQRLQELQHDMRASFDENALAVRAQVRTNFQGRVNISNTPVAQLQGDDRALKKRYSAGRKELEHEFSKTMRYRAIRDLASGLPGEVVLDLRPIWLMSPLSVSDTLPLDSALFDVVIFDEASQIPLEEAIPALYRSHQTIVVGDQMQLPPTQFFSSKITEDEEVDGLTDDGDRVSIVLDSDSFLAQSAVSLPSTMLAWHYRSRSEELIGFSNAAFYGGALSTVPDLHRAPQELPPIVVDQAPSNQATSIDVPSSSGPPLAMTSGERLGHDGVAALLARNVSFHYLEQGVYESRRNSSEANYVAELVRSLLNKETGLTIGVAAFSEAQQGEIDDALQRLATQDPLFAAKLEAEESREDDDQFVGLFVKNLENVQGDERDIIIMSVCYAPGPTGRMVMNFGPINQRGGEKRLNVIFSRARMHMAIVSSIRGSQITNDHNDGANALRRFLDYAEALSIGDTARANGILELVNPLQRRSLRSSGSSPVVEGLADALRQRGLIVEVDHGRSRFRCDLAIRHTQDDDHYLAVMIDTQERATLGSLEERSIVHPMILESFGWRVVHVLTKDWWSQPDVVINTIETAMQR